MLSLPVPPLSTLLPLLPMSVLLRVLPVALMSDEPVSVRFSTLDPNV
jgi:hypothetical protein